jgi:anti-sigma-K factor RskA
MFAELERALPRVSPPADLFDRILDHVAREATVVPLRAGRRRRMVTWAAAATAAAAAVAAIAIVVPTDSGLGTPTAEAVISSPANPTVAGEATIFAAARKIEVSLTAVPAAPSGHHYEVWVLPRGSETMESVGTFHADGHDVTLELDLPGTGPYAAVDVSIEEDAGPSTHSDTSYGSGAFA